MNVEKGFYDILCNDIERLKASHTLNNDERYNLHREIDGRYQACIRQWYNGLWCSNAEKNIIYYNYLSESPKSIRENLDMMCAKLQAYQYQVNAVEQQPSTQINVTTNISVSITFDQARDKIKAMDSLTEQQTFEALQKIDEIEKAFASSNSKKSKWEKVKPILAWLADKSFELAKVVLPLILKIQDPN